LDLRRNEAAKAELETAVRLDPRNTAALYLLALAEKQLEQLTGAAATARKVVVLEPDNADAHYLLAQILAKMGSQSDAVTEWKIVAKLNPERAEVLFNLARHLSKSDPAEAERYQKRFQDLQRKRQITERADMLRNFALAAANARDWNEAVAQAEEALKVCGTCRLQGDLHKNLGLIYCRSGDLARGEQELRMAQNLNPGDPEIIKSLQTIENVRNAARR
jgi:tetratricopeptide (TPR) repeat protein